MKKVFYPKLAWNGIRKNKRLYTPYILTCIGMVMMHYILVFLSCTPALEHMSGGGTMQVMMGFGGWIIAVFAVLFLFYSNSFLMRRRKKEFGLYNIIGMGKKNIARILIDESVIISVLSLAGGLFAGILLSKFAELILVNIMNGQISFTFSVPPQAILQTLLLFCGIFLLLLINALCQVRLSNPIALLRSENTGEKPPRANYVFGILGFLILAAAYYLAVSITEPLLALIWFFTAVVMVILATYLLFIAGSVVLCRILQKKKKYYYRPNHFVSVSSMAYRMKRNGAGLASICILATMVLVMISTSTCMYFGVEDSLNLSYPSEIEFDIWLEQPSDIADENVARLHAEAERIEVENQIHVERAREFRTAEIFGFLENGVIMEQSSDVYSPQGFIIDGAYQLCFVPLCDYNAVMGTEEVLGQDEVMIYAERQLYPYDVFTFQNGKTYQVKSKLEQFVPCVSVAMDVLPSMYVIVPDLNETIDQLFSLPGVQMSDVSYSWQYDFDMQEGDACQIEVYRQMQDRWEELFAEGSTGITGYAWKSRAENRSDFYGTYGGIFFLCIMLSIVFLFATVLIIYYKQICEGYEDQARFDIMQKVGMSKRDIRRNINSQMLIVFFAPLIAAIVHLCFAFPMIRRLLMLFNLVNLSLLLTTAGISALIFAVFYALIYRITSNAYYSIVSGIRQEKE